LTAGTQGRPVFVTASFVDRNHIFLENLPAGEIEVSEDGQPRQVEFLSMDQLPTVYGILIEDVLLSDPAGGERAGYGSIPSASLARNMLYELVDKHIGREPVWLGTYERDLKVVLDFTNDGFKIKESIQGLNRPSGPSDSYLYPALFSAIRKTCERGEKRRVLLLMISSLDAESSGRMRALRNLAAASNLELFVVSFASRLGAPGGLHPSLVDSGLRDLAQATAGEHFAAPQHRDHPEDIVRRLVHQIRTLHTIGFQASSPADNPGKLSIRCTRPGSRVRHHPVVPAAGF
jgi:hypothetical protein